MERLKKAIEGKERWAGLMSYIEQIESNKETNPNISLDATKSLLESIAKTILIDKGQTYDESNVGKLVKQAFSSLPIFVDLGNEDSEETKKILGALSTLTLAIGTLRNKHGFISHGNDLQAKKFNRYLLELAVSSCDVLSSFLIVAYSEDFKDRSRIYYDECEEFNAWFDENNDFLEIAGISISASRALFDQDIVAYKEEYNKYQNDSTALIDSLENIDEDDIDKAEKITTSLKGIPTISQEDVERFTDKAETVVNSYKKVINSFDTEGFNTDLTNKMNIILKNMEIVSNDENLQKNIKSIQKRIDKINVEINGHKKLGIKGTKKEFENILNKKIKVKNWSDMTLNNLRKIK